MKAIILAAGRGSRMKNMTEDRPKCLVELRNKPLLDWQLSAIHEAGISEIAIVTGYKRESLANRALREFYNARWSETNMVSSLACAEEWLKSDTCIVSYSDIFYGSSAIKSLMNTKAELAITFDPNWRSLWESRFVDPLSDAETFKMDADHNLLEIGQKPQIIEDIQGQYMGLLRFTPQAWSTVESLRADLDSSVRDKMDMTSTLQRLIVTCGIKIQALPYTGEWGEVDSEEDLAVYNISPFRI